MRYGRDFRLYATGQAVSAVGDRIATIVLVFLIVHLSRSYAPALALFYVCRVVPTLAGGLVAGAVADRFNRKHLMIGCDLGRALLLAVVPTLGGLSLWSLYPLVIVLYALSLMFSTAARASLPDVVPEGQMMGANAVLNVISTSADLAYAAGGIMIVALKYQIPFYIDAATFGFSALMISGMRIPARPTAPWKNLGDVVSQVQEGVEALLAHAFLKWGAFTLTLGALAGGAFYVVVPLYAQHVLANSGGLVGPLRNPAFRFSILEVGIGAGAVLGSAATPRLSARWPRGRVFGLGVLGLGVCDGALALTTNIYVATAVMVVSGAFNSLFVVSGMTLLQTLTPSEIRGRVVSAQLTLITLSLAVGSALGGPLLLLVAYPTLLLVLGTMIVLASLMVWIRPTVRGQA